MRTLVAGGSGFIGSFIVDYLAAEGHQVTIFDLQRPTRQLPENVRYVEGDIRYQGEIEAVLGWDTEEVYDVAGVLGTSELNCTPQRAVEVNVLGAVNVLDACRARNVARVFTPTKPNDWLNLYSITKYAAEQIALHYQADYGMSIAVTKWFNAYGPRQHLYPVRKALPLFIVQALRGLPLEIYGDGEQTVDMIYVSDIARIAVLATRQCGRIGKVLDVGSGIPLTVNDLAAKVVEMCDSDSEIVWLPMRAGEPPRSQICANVEPLNAHLDYGRMTPLDRGLRASIEYYRSLPREEVDRALDHFSPRSAA